jgi:hypothetical protein
MDSVGTPPERQGPDLGNGQWLDAAPAGAVADASRYWARNGVSAASSSSGDSSARKWLVSGMTTRR